MKKVRRIPVHEDSNGWWEISAHQRPVTSVTGEVHVKTAIIGGGGCGLSTANRLAELCPDDEICVVDAERIGYGASGRNAGFLSDFHSHGAPKNLDVLQNSRRFWEAGLASLRDKVNKWGIDCDWSDAGRIYGAAGPDGVKRTQEIAATLDALNMEYKRLSQSDFQRLIGTEFYSEGLYVPGNALVNPSALMEGIAKNLPSNVSIYENSPVINFERCGTGYKVRAPQGVITAERLVVASGVFLKDFGIATGRYVPIATYGSLSAPLNSNELSCLGEGNEFGLLASSQIGSTIRLTGDKRLFVRNYINFEPGAPVRKARLSKIVGMHHQAMTSRWPALHGVQFQHSWGGAMALTTNNGSVFGEFDKNLYAVLTNDVSPITRGEASGTLLAEFMEGHKSDLLSLQLSRPYAKRLPPRPFLDVGIQFQKIYLNQIASKEI